MPDYSRVIIIDLQAPGTYSLAKYKYRYNYKYKYVSPGPPTGLSVSDVNIPIYPGVHTVRIHLLSLVSTITSRAQDQTLPLHPELKPVETG